VATRPGGPGATLSKIFFDNVSPIIFFKNYGGYISPGPLGPGTMWPPGPEGRGLHYQKYFLTMCPP